LTVFETVLVANRGEIAVRVIRTLQRLGIKAIAVYSAADDQALHVRTADEAVLIGPAPAAESYLNAAAVLEAARVTGAEAIHPGYGFLSENADFARQVSAAGLTWIGPPVGAIQTMGDKVRARRAVAPARVPVGAGTPDPVRDLAGAARSAGDLGYPLMVKAAAGGGGIGMSVVRSESELVAAFETAQARAERFFGSPEILLERYVSPARHVEVQVLGLATGRVVALGERDCSLQRRHQKVLEESPAPLLDPALRERMFRAAECAALAVDYRGAGTVEFLVDPSTGEYLFLEMNTRLQVEHPVTELVTGLDLVEQQLLIAAGEPPSFDPDRLPDPVGHAVEFRLYAEDPVRFLPGPGKITTWTEPAGPGIRVDSGYAAGDTVTPYYDPLMAQLCAHGRDRAEALARLRQAAAAFEVAGPRSNLPLLFELLDHPDFVSGRYDTQLISRMRE
jgi:acetyl-CoA carboxylase, biotin carboxylase subunit